MILYPQHGSGPPFARVKPEQPLVTGGRPAKYLSPMGRGLQAYIPPRSWENLEDANTRVLLTEGEKKAAEAAQEGLACIGLGGVWAFRDRDHLFLPDLDKIAWSGRDVVLAPDSDIATNPQVRDAVWEFGWQLLQRGGLPTVVVLPPGADGSKQGVDDYLVVHGRSALENLISTADALEAWACSVVAAMPDAHKPAQLQWLAGRLEALDTARRELIVHVQAKRLGLTPSFLRRLMSEVGTWAPAPPRAEREKAEREAARLTSGVSLPGTCRLIHASLSDLDQHIEPSSIDSIVTDPPYGEEIVFLCEELARLSLKWLKDNGSLLVMVGQYRLPEGMERMARWLTYHWALAYLTPGGQSGNHRKSGPGGSTPSGSPCCGSLRERTRGSGSAM